MRSFVHVLVLYVAALASAQSARTLRGFVHRDVAFGCGQMWRSDVTLEVDGARATLHLDARVVDASGGVDAATGPHHDETTRTMDITWAGA